jgi:D-alanine transaminase/branched-chain amino acid aminotransferase
MQSKMNRYTLVNGTFLPAPSASVIITDLAIQRGYGIFDFFKSISGQIMFLDDHLDRFFNSAAEMHLPVRLTRDEIKTLLSDLMDKNNLPDSGIRITLTGGYAADGYTLSEPNMIITQNVFNNPGFNEKGIKLMTYPHLRQLAQVKTLDYLIAIWLQPLIKDKGADDVLYHHNGMIKECPRANFFIVNADGDVLTSKDQVLKGVVRKQLLEMSSPGLKIYEKEISLEDIQHCKEAFISSSTKNVLPVTEIDGKTIGGGTAGEITRQLAAQFRELTLTV